MYLLWMSFHQTRQEVVLEGVNFPKVKNKEMEAVKTLHIPLCYPKYTDLWFNIHTMFFL